MTENRKETQSQTRDRINEIFEMVETDHKMVVDDHNRFQKFSTKVIVFVSIVFVMSGISIAGFSYALEQVNASRVDASERSCIIRDNQDTGIRTVFAKFNIKDPQLLGLFPIVKDCRKFAEDQLKTK